MRVLFTLHLKLKAPHLKRPDVFSQIKPQKMLFVNLEFFVLLISSLKRINLWPVMKLDKWRGDERRSMRWRRWEQCLLWGVKKAGGVWRTWGWGERKGSGMEKKGGGGGGLFQEQRQSQADWEKEEEIWWRELSSFLFLLTSSSLSLPPPPHPFHLSPLYVSLSFVTARLDLLFSAVMSVPASSIHPCVYVNIRIYT